MTFGVESLLLQQWLKYIPTIEISYDRWIGFVIFSLPRSFTAEHTADIKK
jgi:hypothetical protein